MAVSSSVRVWILLGAEEERRVERLPDERSRGGGGGSGDGERNNVTFPGELPKCSSSGGGRESGLDRTLFDGAELLGDAPSASC